MAMNNSKSFIDRYVPNRGSSISQVPNLAGLTTPTSNMFGSSLADIQATASADSAKRRQAAGQLAAQNSLSPSMASGLAQAGHALGSRLFGGGDGVSEADQQKAEDQEAKTAEIKKMLKDPRTTPQIKMKMAEALMAMGTEKTTKIGTDIYKMAQAEISEATRLQERGEDKQSALDAATLKHQRNVQIASVKAQVKANEAKTAASKPQSYSNYQKDMRDIIAGKFGVNYDEMEEGAEKQALYEKARLVWQDHKGSGLGFAAEEYGIKALATAETEIYASGIKAREDNWRFDQTLQTMDEAYTGVGGAAVSTWNKIMTAFGGEGDGGSAEALRSLTVSNALAFSQLTKGAISNTEWKAFLAAAGGLSTTRAGNRYIMQVAKQNAQYKMRLTSHYGEWRKLNRRATLSDWVAEMSRYHNSTAEGEGGFKLVKSELAAAMKDKTSAMITDPTPLGQKPKEETTSVLGGIGASLKPNVSGGAGEVYEEFKPQLDQDGNPIDGNKVMGGEQSDVEFWNTL